MKQHRFGRLPLASGALALCLQLPLAHAQLDYRQTNLVSDLPGMARHTDSNLVNPWGIASSTSSPLWVSNADAGVATVYNGSGTKLPLTVSIPNPFGGAGSPTGQVFNSNGAAYNGDRFIFATEEGTIAGWRGGLGTSAETLAIGASGSSYKGLAIADVGSTTYLYAANFGKGTVDVFNAPGSSVNLTGSFTDPNLPSGYSPFNVQNVGGSLFVSFAKTSDEPGEEQAGAGLGFVDKFDLNGNLLMRVASNGVLNAPWAVTQAPGNFGKFSGSLLVGNFGDGTINAFDMTTGDLIGSLKDSQGNPLVIEGLWGLRFGNGGAGGNTNTLYFAAGIDDEAHGLFGSITPVPEPTTTGVVAALGLIGYCALRLRRRKPDETPPAPAAS